ncbi:MAG TPA: CBS domain-containing protein [Micromonosporaceae bacterium]
MLHRRISDVMTADVAALREDTPYRDIVELFTGRGVSGAPVLDENGRVVGVVSAVDLLRKIEYAGGLSTAQILESAERQQARAKAVAATARQVMTAPAYTISPDATVGAAARMMDSLGVKRLPVVDDQRRLRGIVTRTDLLRVFLHADDLIAGEVRREVFDRVLGLDPARVAVAVAGGVVTLSGTLPRRRDVEIAVRLTRAVDGVVEVVDRLGYEGDSLDDDASARLWR